MGATTKISWTDATWTPIRARVRDDAAAIAKKRGYRSLVTIAKEMAGRVGPHCERVSPGCGNCYSEANNARRLPQNGTGLPFDRRARDLVDVVLDRNILEQPFHWKKPRRIFVCSQTDLFGEWVPYDVIDEVFSVMVVNPQHTFQIVTKRAADMRAYFESGRHDGGSGWDRATYHLRQNIWLGVSAEDQERANERIPQLIRTPATLRFVSYEPALGALDLSQWTEEGLECSECSWTGTEEFAVEDGNENDPGYRCPRCGEACAHTPLDELLGGDRGIKWVIIGGESGSGARPFYLEWARNTIAQCKTAGIACFVKQLGALALYQCDGIGCGHCQVPHFRQLRNRSGADPDEWPADLNVQQFPPQVRS